MSLCFLMARRYAPYPKWFGTHFARLPIGPTLVPILRRAQTASCWQEREKPLCQAFEILAEQHNALGLTGTMPAKASPFWGRPFQVIHGESFAEALVARLSDPAVQAIARRMRIGSIDQFSDNTDLREGRTCVRCWRGSMAATEGGALVPRRIEIVAYDSNWPTLYEAEGARLRAVFGPDLVAIHHIGSTAVPGLLAKPIIDIMVVIRDIRRIGQFDAGMNGLGYRVRGECLEAFGTPGRFYFSKDTNGIRTYQAHVMEAGHPETREKLAFRDYLRAHPHEAAAYGDLKRRLVGTNTQGIAEYIRGKDGFVKTLIQRAAAWNGQGQ